MLLGNLNFKKNPEVKKYSLSFLNISKGTIKLPLPELKNYPYFPKF